MGTPKETIAADLRTALKARDRERVDTLRLLMSSIDNERIKNGEEVDDTRFLALVQRAIKQRKESAGEYRKGGREELAAKEEREAEILTAYLPRQVDENEIRAAIQEFVTAQGLSGSAGIGPVMKEMLARFAGRTDGGTINRIARELL